MEPELNHALFLEFQSVTHYLLGKMPEAWVQQNLPHYARGLRFHEQQLSENSNWNWAREDARASRSQDPHSPARLRLILAHAIWETDPRTAHLYLPTQQGWVSIALHVLYHALLGVWRRLWHFR